jgi:hypothetical protein
MSRQFLFADEAGDFAFSPGPRTSRYYIVCTVVMKDCHAGTGLLELRRKLAWDKQPIRDYFHAAEDRQSVRDHVFSYLQGLDFSIQATIMEKSKALPRIRPTEERLYKYGWHYHFKFSADKYLELCDELQITVASIGTKKKRTEFEDAVRDVVAQKVARKRWKASFWPCQTDPCLQIADYCTWAIQRKWERQDTRSFDLISNKVNHEVDMWAHGTHHHYTY